MTLPDSLTAEIVEAVAKAAFERLPPGDTKGWPREWEELPSFVQYTFREPVLEFVSPILPVIESYSDKGWESAAVLLGRIEMLVADWKHRESLMSPQSLATELQAVLDEPMEKL